LSLLRDRIEYASDEWRREFGKVPRKFFEPPGQRACARPTRAAARRAYIKSETFRVSHCHRAGAWIVGILAASRLSVGWPALCV
jgi:hypothetical protein